MKGSIRIVLALVAVAGLASVAWGCEKNKNKDKVAPTPRETPSDRDQGVNPNDPGRDNSVAPRSDEDMNRDNSVAPGTPPGQGTAPGEGGTAPGQGVVPGQGGTAPGAGVAPPQGGTPPSGATPPSGSTPPSQPTPPSSGTGMGAKLVDRSLDGTMI